MLVENFRTPVIEVSNLSKTYGSGVTAFHALKSVNLTIFEGESVAIVGKSGSGKSTLMHLLALLDSPDRGSVVIDGVSAGSLGVSALNTLRNETFGFIFQQFFLNPGGSVLDNVELPLKIAGMPKGVRRGKALKVLQELELDSKARNRATDLSGGQKQRAVIARALVNDPRIIFADEPTGNLDSATGEVVEGLLFGLNRDRGITLIVVTHDEDLAAKCDRQVRLKDGVVVFDSAHPELEGRGEASSLPAVTGSVRVVR